MSERQERCGTCRYLEQIGGIDENSTFVWPCHRFPRPEPKQLFDWCGEWKPHCPTGSDPFPFGQLSVRANNVLKKNFPRVKTFDNLMEVGRHLLCYTNNCGETTIAEFDKIAKAAGVAEQWRKS